MSLNDTPRSGRTHIAVFGRRNAGKSSLINALTGQETSLVSDIGGTTTDPVYKSMELLPLGPVVLIDTAGLDDEGVIGELRKKKTIEVLNKTDIAVLVTEASHAKDSFETDIIKMIKEKGIPVIGVLNKVDLTPVDSDTLKSLEDIHGIKLMPASASTGMGIDALKKQISEAVPSDEDRFTIVGDIISPGDIVVLVVPIDKAAPKGRLILPQQQTIRDILESDAVCVVSKEHELRETLMSLSKKPRLVITDSQVFLKVAADTPPDVPLTSFSILFARAKGDLTELVRGAKAVEKLRDGDKVLIAEACTHHRQSDDIGLVKIPRWIRQATGKQLIFEHYQGNGFPENLESYSLIIHCGACMLNARAMRYRIEQAVAANVPIVNYGVVIAYVQGILERALSPFPSALYESNQA